jgi:hypothetical protein
MGSTGSRNIGARGDRPADAVSAKEKCAKRLLGVLNQLEVDLGLREGFPVDWTVGEIEDEITGSFERLGKFLRCFMVINPNG